MNLAVSFSELCPEQVVGDHKVTEQELGLSQEQVMQRAGCVCPSQRCMTRGREGTGETLVGGTVLGEG